MSRILLADHSPHAQRMGERILRDEGFEVVTVTDGDTALLRLKEIEPDLILADISLPNRSGYEICDYVKSCGKYPRTHVVLTAGPLATLDDARAQHVRADGFLKKPFEASLLLNSVQPLLEEPAPSPAPEPDRWPAAESTSPTAAAAPAAQAPAPIAAATAPAVAAAPAVPPAAPIDREQVRAAVILALEASMISIIENITDKVLVALQAAPPQPPPSGSR